MSSTGWRTSWALPAHDVEGRQPAHLGVVGSEASNRQSWRVMQKAGFTFACQFDYQGTPHVLYRRQTRLAAHA